MSTFILIHGAWHGGWCWSKVIPLLEQQGHKVYAPDLPGHGNDETPIFQVTMQSYTDCVCNILKRQSQPAILIGHSMGGSVVSQSAEYCPDKVEKLVYLAAYMLKNGESVLQALLEDTGSLLTSNIVGSEDQMSSTVKEESIKELFYLNCSESETEWAKSRLVPQASIPIGTPITITNEKYGKIPKVYVECLNDQVITPEYQKKMYSEFDCEKIISMNSDHFPLLNSSEELVSQLVTII